MPEIQERTDVTDECVAQCPLAAESEAPSRRSAPDYRTADRNLTGLGFASCDDLLPDSKPPEKTRAGESPAADRPPPASLAPEKPHPEAKPSPAEKTTHRPPQEKAVEKPAQGKPIEKPVVKPLEQQYGNVYLPTDSSMSANGVQLRASNAPGEFGDLRRVEFTRPDGTTAELRRFSINRAANGDYVIRGNDVRVPGAPERCYVINQRGEISQRDPRLQLEAKPVPADKPQPSPAEFRTSRDRFDGREVEEQQGRFFVIGADGQRREFVLASDQVQSPAAPTRIFDGGVVDNRSDRPVLAVGKGLPYPGNEHGDHYLRVVPARTCTDGSRHDFDGIVTDPAFQPVVLPDGRVLMPKEVPATAALRKIPDRNTGRVDADGSTTLVRPMLPPYGDPDGAPTIGRYTGRPAPITPESRETRERDTEGNRRLVEARRQRDRERAEQRAWRR